jgi:hypothetical protein
MLRDLLSRMLGRRPPSTHTDVDIRLSKVARREAKHGRHAAVQAVREAAKAAQDRIQAADR